MAKPQNGCRQFCSFSARGEALTTNDPPALPKAPRLSTTLSVGSGLFDPPQGAGAKCGKRCVSPGHRGRGDGHRLLISHNAAAPRSALLLRANISIVAFAAVYLAGALMFCRDSLAELLNMFHMLIAARFTRGRV